MDIVDPLPCSYELSLRKPPYADQRRDSQSVNPSHPGTNNFSNDLNTNNRVRRVLDALASLCVSRPHAQDFAIGFRISSGKSLVITNANSRAVEQATINYLTRLWGILRTLSNLYTGKRPKGGCPLGLV